MLFPDAMADGLCAFMVLFGGPGWLFKKLNQRTGGMANEKVNQGLVKLIGKLFKR